MRKIEAIKVGLNFAYWAGLMETQFEHFSGGLNPAKSCWIPGEIVALLKCFLWPKIGILKNVHIVIK